MLVSISQEMAFMPFANTLYMMIPRIRRMNAVDSIISTRKKVSSIFRLLFISEFIITVNEKMHDQVEKEGDCEEEERGKHQG